jgi:ribosomal protein S18 acetylase RimI-like enzyme
MSSRLHLRSCKPSPESMGILSQSMGSPTKGNLSRLIDRYTDEWQLEGAFRSDQFVGCVGYSMLALGEIEIQHIAVAAAHQRQGVGRFILDALKSRFNIQRIFLYTDSETTAFYKKNAFTVVSTGLSKWGIERFACEWIG